MRSQRKLSRLQYRAGTKLNLLVGILMSLLPVNGIALQASSCKKVLVLYWYNKDYSWNISFDESFQVALRSDKALSVEYYSEYLETDRFPEEKQSAALHAYLRRKNSDCQIDVLVATASVPAGSGVNDDSYLVGRRSQASA